MKKAIQLFLITLSISFALISINSGCKKETIRETVTDTIFHCSPNIEGLYEGTYTVGPGSPVPTGTQFYFSFSIYPNGKVSYKSKGYYNGSLDYITFADGTFSLTNNQFTFDVTTINNPGSGPQHTQSGSATFNGVNGTLSNGTITDPLGGSATWSMTRVN